MTHKMAKTALYQVWKNIKRRCNNEFCPVYSFYGGRGIGYCRDWENFIPFRDWAIANGYVEGGKLEIDRVDNNGNYEPKNCRWTDRTTQIRNRSNTIRVQVWGLDVSLPEALEDPRSVVSYSTAISRIKRGWSHERALTVTPKGSSNKKLKA